MEIVFLAMPAYSGRTNIPLALKMPIILTEALVGRKILAARFAAYVTRLHWLQPSISKVHFDHNRDST